MKSTDVGDTKRHHLNFFIVIISITTVLAFACLVLWEVVKYDGERDVFLRVGEHLYYQFDGSQPIARITVVPTQTILRDLIYTPQLTSQDYLTLASGIPPTQFVTDDAVLTGVSYSYYDCSHPTRIDAASFTWTVVDKEDPFSRHTADVLVAPTVGQLTFYEQLVTGKYHLPEQSQRANPNTAELVLENAQNAFATTNEGLTLLDEPDCLINSFAYTHQPRTWAVGFSSTSLKRTVYYEVDTGTMQASPERQRVSIYAPIDPLVVLLALGVVALLVLLYIRHEQRRLRRIKKS